MQEHLAETQPEQQLCSVLTPLLYSPNGDEIVVGLCLQQSEVEMDPVAHRHCKEPRAVLGIGVLVGKARRVNCPILGGDIAPTRHCRTKQIQPSEEISPQNNDFLISSLSHFYFFFLGGNKSNSAHRWIQPQNLSLPHHE